MQFTCLINKSEFALFILGALKFRECLNFVPIKIGLILIKHWDILRRLRCFSSRFNRKYEIVGRRD